MPMRSKWSACGVLRSGPRLGTLPGGWGSPGGREQDAGAQEYFALSGAAEQHLGAEVGRGGLVSVLPHGGHLHCCKAVLQKLALA